MRRQRVFANTADAIGNARRYVIGQLSDVPRHIVDEIAIMVSELATNCVRHTVTDFTISVEQTRGRIRVEVTDSGGGTPTVRSPEPQEPSGRGLRIVHELADSFGIQAPTGSPGKTVWFIVELEEPSHRTEHRSPLRGARRARQATEPRRGRVRDADKRVPTATQVPRPNQLELTERANTTRAPSTGSPAAAPMNNRSTSDPRDTPPKGSPVCAASDPARDEVRANGLL